jgi:hypothetical protein
MANEYQTRLYELQSFTATPGVVQSLQFDIRGLPRGQRVAAFLMVSDSTFTYQAAQGQPNQLFTSNYSIVAGSQGQFNHQSAFLKVRATGAGLYRLNQHMTGKALSDDSLKLSSGGTVYSRAVAVLPVADANQFAPTDTAIPTELLNGTSLQLITTGAQFAALGWVDNSGNPAPQGTNIGGSMVYRLFAALIEGAGAIDPTPSCVDYEDWGGQTVLLGPGAYSHMMVYRDPLGPSGAGTIDLNAGLTRLTWNIAGAPVIQNVFSWASVLEFNRNVVSGGFVDNDREQLSASDVPFCPIYTPPPKYKITGLPQSDKPDSILQFSGSLTQFRVLYRKLEGKSEQQVRAAANAFGISQFSRSIKTASKAPIAGGSNAVADVMRRAELSRILPGRIKGSRIPGRG